MREDADVAAAQNRDARIERRLETRALVRNPGRLGPGSFLPSRVLRRRITSRQGRTQRDILLRHELEYFRRAVVAMLDRFYTGHDRPAHPFRRGRVGDDRTPAALRRFDDR